MPDIPLLRLNLDPKSPFSLFQQVYRALRHRIVSGQMASGDRLPPTRKLADELGISRTTIVTAYDQLTAEGYIDARPGAGMYVRDIGEVELPPSKPALIGVDTRPKLRNIVPKPFHPGQPDMRLFPYQQWARCVARVARRDPQALVMNTELFGNYDLRVEICRYLSEWRGVKAVPQQILITAGSGEALELCILTLAQEGERIALETPCYPPLYSFVKSLGLPIDWLEVDDQGATIPKVTTSNQRPKLAFLTPSSQFPLGGAMQQARRNEFLSWAEQSQSWIVEDDFDSEFRYAGRPFPALASFDHRERVLYVGSFSKIFSNGLRLGFLVVPDQLMERLNVAVRKFGAKASALPQQPLALFMRSGEFYRHIRRVRRIYAERRNVLIKLLEERLGEFASFDDHQAGMQITIRLPFEYDDKKLSAALSKKGLKCPALSTYYKSTHSQNGLVLGFCGFTTEEMQDAMDVLCETISEMT